MRTTALTVIFMFISLAARADKPKADDAIAAARKWLTAIHDRDVDAAVAVVSVPLADNLCGGAKPVVTRDDAATVKKRFTCLVGDVKPTWSIEKNVKFSIATAEDVRSLFAQTDPASKAPLSNLAADHQLVLAATKVVTAPSPVRPSYTESYYLFAVGAGQARVLTIDAIVQSLLVKVAN